MTATYPGQPLVVVERGADRETWLAARKGRVTASNVAAIMGISSYADAEAILKREAKASTIEMRMGLYLETAILLATSLEHELDIDVEVPALLAHRDRPWLACSLDGIVCEPEGEPVGPIDAKNVGAYVSDEYLLREYSLQVETQAYITGLAKGYLAVCRGGQRVDVLEVDVNLERYAEEVLPVLQRFHRVQRGELDLEEADLPFGWGALSRTSAVEGLTIDLKVRQAQLVERYRRAKVRAEHYSAKADALGDKVRELLGPAEVGRKDGRKIVSWRAVEQHRVDTTALRAAEPEVAERFTKVIATRRLLLHNP